MDEKTHTALHWAAKCGRADDIEALTAAGAPLDAKDAVRARPAHRGPSVLSAAAVDIAAPAKTADILAALGTYMQRMESAVARVEQAAAQAEAGHINPASSAIGWRTATRPHPYEASTGTPSTSR